MPTHPQSIKHGRAARCAVCDGKFGLVRHYSWRAQLCSGKCVDRFRARRESDRAWLPLFHAVFNPMPATHARMS